MHRLSSTQNPIGTKPPALLVAQALRQAMPRRKCPILDAGEALGAWVSAERRAWHLAIYAEL